MSLIGGYLVACCLLALAGFAKALRPNNTAMAIMQAVPLRSVSVWKQVVRIGSVGEGVLGVAAALVPDAGLAGAVAASYVAFAAFVLWVRLRGGVLATCGCFSEPDTPPTKLHVVINLALAACASVVAASSPHPLMPSLLSRQPLGGVPLIAASAVCVWLVITALVSLPRLAEARRLFEEGTNAS